MNLGLAEQIWVWFTYEQLLDVCFCCGRFSHNHWECSLWESMKETCEREGFPYGNWLKAAPRSGNSEYIVKSWTMGQRIEERSSDKHQGSTPTGNVLPYHHAKEDTRALSFSKTDMGQRKLHRSGKGQKGEQNKEKTKANMFLKTTIGCESVNPLDIITDPNHTDISDPILREAHSIKSLNPPNTYTGKPNSEGPGHLTEVSSSTLTQQVSSSPFLESFSSKHLHKWKKRARIRDFIPLPNF